MELIFCSVCGWFAASVWGGSILHQGWCPRGQYGSRYSRMDQVKFLEDSLFKICCDLVCVSRPYYFKIFKGCLP